MNEIEFETKNFQQCVICEQKGSIQAPESLCPFGHAILCQTHAELYRDFTECFMCTQIGSLCLECFQFPKSMKFLLYHIVQYHYFSFELIF